MSSLARRTLPRANRPDSKRKIDAAMAAAQREAKRRSFAWRRRANALRQVFLLSLFSAALFGAWWVHDEGHTEQLIRVGENLWVEVPAPKTLRVAQVRIDGLVNANQQRVVEQLGPLEGRAILSLSLGELREKLLTIGWVKEATIKRSLPGVIDVRIIEREPYAIWQHEGALRLIDSGGEEITREGLGSWEHLPLVVGADAPQAAGRLIDVLRTEPALIGKVHAMVHVGARRWDLQFNNGVEVMLPEQQVAEAWARLAELDEIHAILSRDIAVLDMRLPDRLTIRPGATNKNSVQNI
jgi:cell division septal protein FtsQ